MRGHSRDRYRLYCQDHCQDCRPGPHGRRRSGNLVHPAGHDVLMIAAMSGHKSGRTLREYAIMSPEALQRKMEATDPAGRR